MGAPPATPPAGVTLVHDEVITEFGGRGARVLSPRSAPPRSLPQAPGFTTDRDGAVAHASVAVRSARWGAPPAAPPARLALVHDEVITEFGGRGARLALVHTETRR